MPRKQRKVMVNCAFGECRRFALDGSSEFCPDHLNFPPRCEMGCCDNFRGKDSHKYATTKAAANGHLHCLQLLHSKGVPVDENAAQCAAARGHLDCLKWLHGIGRAFGQSYTNDYALTYFAALNGHLNCLQYAHQNGCKLRQKFLCDAVFNSHWDCVEYAQRNGCVIETFERDFILATITKETDLTANVHLRLILQNPVFGGHLRFLDRVKVDEAFERHRGKLEQISEIFHQTTSLPSAVITHEILSFL